MESQQNIKALFKEIFPSLKGKEKTPAILKEAFLKLINDNNDDKIIFKIFCYFFPAKSSQEQNSSTEFWYEKYQSSEKYTEYNIALDILLILKDYLANKNEQKANDQIFQIIIKLGDYKNVNYYLLLTAKHAIDIFIHLLSFFIKDKDYFQKSLKVSISSNDDLTDPATMERLFCGKTFSKEELFTKKYCFLLLKNQTEINKNQEEINKKQLEINQKLNKEIKVLMDYTAELENKIKEIDEQLEQIYLRDTIEYSIKYIYRLFFQKYGKDEKFQSNVHLEMQQLKEMLKNSELSQFKYLFDFIVAVQDFDLNSLNNKAHPFIKERDFDAIMKYIDNKKPYLKNVVDFLKKCPKLSDYINFEVNNYLSKDDLEDKIKTQFDFDSFYNQVISI